MELEFFCDPKEEMEWFNYWRSYCADFLRNLGMKEENMRLRDHSQEELSHYSNATTDIEYLFPFGWGELWGIADRTDFDLKAHMEHSGENFTYQDPVTNENTFPIALSLLWGPTAWLWLSSAKPMMRRNWKTAIRG